MTVEWSPSPLDTSASRAATVGWSLSRPARWAWKMPRAGLCQGRTGEPTVSSITSQFSGVRLFPLNSRPMMKPDYSLDAEPGDCCSTGFPTRGVLGATYTGRSIDVEGRYPESKHWVERY